MEDFNKYMVDKLGYIPNIDKTIQELNELAEALRVYRTMLMINPECKDKILESGLVSHIKEERVDVSVMLKRLDHIFGFKIEDLKKIKINKINRTKLRYK